MEPESKEKTKRARSLEHPNYYRLLLQEPEDKNLILRSQIFKAAHKKIKGESIKIENERDKFIQREANNIIELAQKIDPADATYESVKRDFIKLRQYSQVKMAMFQLELSGSSEQQFDPHYQSADDVIVIASGAPEIIQFYLIGKIESQQNVRIQPMIKSIQALNGAQIPVISIAQRIGSFTIYKLTISSLTRKYIVVAQTENHKLSSEVIIFDNKQNSRLLLNRGFIFNFSEGKMTNLELLEQILIFSVYEPTQKQYLKKFVQKITLENKKQMKISDQLIESISIINQKHYFYQLLMELTDPWKIQSKNIIPQQSMIYKLIAKSFMAESETLTQNMNQGLRYQLTISLLDVAIQSDTNQNFKVLNNKERKTMVEKILKQIKLISDFQTIFLVIQKFYITNSKILNQVVSAENFIEDYVKPISQTNLQRLAGQIFSACYYSNIFYAKEELLKSMTVILNSITPIAGKINPQGSKYLPLSLPYLSDILKNPQRIKIKQLESQYIYKLLKLYPILRQLQQFDEAFDKNIDKQISNYISKEMFKFSKDKKNLQNIILILKEFYFNEGIVNYFINPNKIASQLSAKLQRIINDISRVDDDKQKQKLFKKFNSQLITQAIKKNIDISQIKQTYIKSLYNRGRIPTFDILNTGTSDEMFQQESNQQRFDEILKPIIDNYYTNYNIFSQNWSMGFKFCYHINQKILQKMIQIGYKHHDNLDKPKFYSDLESIVEAEVKPEYRERLRIIILEYNMIIDKENIKTYLMQKQKLYLKILLNILNKKQGRKQQVISVISAISYQIQNNQITYDQLIRMIPILPKDQQRFIQLFSKNIFQKMVKIQQDTQSKIDRLGKIKKMVNVIKNKFSVPRNQIDELNQRIDKNKQILVSCKISDQRKVQIFENFADSILNLYEYEFFFKNFDNKLNSIDKVMQKAGEHVDDIISKLRKILKDIQKQEISYEQYSFFNFDQMPQKQIKNLLKICKITETEVSQITKIVSFNKKIYLYRQICLNLQFFIKNDKQLSVKVGQNITQILNFATKIKSGIKNLKIQCSQYQAKINIMKQILSKINIKLNTQQQQLLINNTPLDNILKNVQTIKKLQKDDKNISTLLSLIIIGSRVSSLQKLAGFKGSIQYIKQYLLDNNNPSINIDHQDFQNYTEIIPFYEKCIISNLSQSGSLIKLLESIKGYKSNKQQKQLSLNCKITTLTNKTNQFQMCFLLLKNPAHMQSVNIKKLVENSRIVLNQYSHNHQFKLSIYGENSYQPIQLTQLDKYKDQAHIIKSKVSDYEDLDEKEEIYRKIQSFLSMYAFLHNIRETLEELFSLGLIIFQDQEITMRIIDGNLDEMVEFLKIKSQLLKKWDSSLKEIYGFSFKATMLRGSKLKQFYDVIMNAKSDQKNLEIFRYIADKSLILKFIKQLDKDKKLKKQNVKDPLECLQVIKRFFIFHKNQTQKTQKPAPDRDEQYIEVLRFSEQDTDYFYSLNEAKPQKLKNIKQGQIISCNRDTTKQDIESFIQRSIRDPDNQYFIMKYDNLSQDLQKIAIQRIQQSFLNNNNRMKLVLTGREAAHKIYQYVNLKMNVTKRIQGGERKQHTPQFKQLMNNSLNKNQVYGIVRIYTSSYPGLGKTYTILKNIEQQKKSPIFFSISGRTTSQNLYNRLEKKISQSRNRQYDIIIQLYEIDKGSQDIVNNFLTQIVVFRSYYHKSQFCCLKSKCRVFIQIQDQTIMTTMPIIKFIKDYKIVVTIDKFDNGLIQYKIENTKLCYILEHLEMFDSKKLDTIDLPRYSDYKPTKIIENYIALLTKYFVQPFSRLSQPTFYQFKYWVDLFYESCSSFTGSYQISRKFFLNDYGEPNIKKYQIQHIRSDFFNVLLQNSVHFLAFSIQNLLETDFSQEMNQQSRKKKDLNHIPFFIVPNNECQWFSLIYRQFSQIPKAIRSFLVSQALVAEKKQHGNKTPAEMQKIIGQRYELADLQKQNRKQFQSRLQSILKDISGITSYKLSDDPGYVLNLDNFIKICLISYKMKVNIPLLIQGQAGVGKTALLRHLIQQVFKYQFIPHTINAGVTQQLLRTKIEEARIKLQDVELLNKDKDKRVKKKVCIFFDEFNTLPELGYIKEIMMENRFMGDEMQFFKDLIVFAACNPFRDRQIHKDHQKQKREDEKLAFSVKRPPLSMGQIMWNFGSLSDAEMNKYISRMLSELQNDHKNKVYIDLICQIQNKLNDIQFGSASLRDVQRFRQLYSWLKSNLPDESKIQLTSLLNNHYDNKPLRAFIIALSLSYFTRLNTKTKIEEIVKIVNQLSTIKYDTMMQFKKFQQDDFSSRLKINYQGISLNSALKENLFSIFICIMKCLPILIVGSPGCSKSLATRIISDNFKEGIQLSKDYNQWLKQFPRTVEFFFQGSESCLTKSVQNRFIAAQNFADFNLKQITKQSDRKIPLFIFDEMGLAEKSPDNPLKAIHQPLQLTPHKKVKNQSNRSIAFLGISNTQLDLSKMSRFLVLRRPQMSLQDLKKTAKQISKGVFGKLNFNHANIEPYLDYFGQTYDEFLKLWRQTQGTKSETHRQFFGLRDFYNLIRTFSDLIKGQENKNKLEKIDEFCDLAIYRNFSGLANSYQHFRDIFFKKKLKKQIPQIQHNALHEIIESFKTKSRRFPLVIVRDDISQSVFCQNAQDEFQETVIISGSPFTSDISNSQYVVKMLTRITKIVASQNKLISISLNKSVEGALFDLFNKFFIKRDGSNIYRVTMQSGLMVTSVVNQKFNASVILNYEDLRNQSSAFLNRFEKYELDINSVKNTKIDQIVAKLNKIFLDIQRICQAEELGHYKIEDLFFNYTAKTLKSLVYQVCQENEHMKEPELLSMCIRTISKVASKDFEYILNLVMKTKQQYQNQHIKSFIQGVEQKAEFLRKSQKAILITSDQDIWKTNKNMDRIISLQLYKNQESLKKQIEQFMSDPNSKQGTLFIDYSRESEDFGANLNDPRIYLKQNQNKIEVHYIINLIKRCKESILLEKKKIESQKVRIILNHNRNKKERFTQVSFMLGYPIFSLDGSNSNSNKQKIFETVNMKKVIQKCMKCFKFALVEAQQNQSLVKAFNELITQFARNEGIFSQCCKDALLMLEADSTQISDQQIILSLKNRNNLKNYNSISLALTKEYFEKKFTSPIIMLIQILADDKILLNYAQNSKNILLSKIVDSTRQKQDNYEQKNSESMTKFMLAMTKRKIEKNKSSYKQKKIEGNFPNQENPMQLKVNMPTYFPYSHLETNILFSPQILQKIKIISKSTNSINENFNQFEQQYNNKLQQVFFKPEILTHYRNLTRSTNKYWKRMFMADVAIILSQMAKIPATYAFYFINQIQKLLKQHENSFLKKMVIILGQFDAWSSALRIWNAFIQVGIDKNMETKREFEFQIFGKDLLRHSTKLLALNETSLQGLKAQTINQKLLIFTEIHHSVHFQIQNLLASKMIQQSAQQYTQMTITQQFITIWQAIRTNIQDNEISKMLKQLTNEKTIFAKISVFANFFQSILEIKPETQKIIYQYLANKLYPKWFKYCQTEEQVNKVFGKFYQLCQKSMPFAHNSIESIEIALSSIKIDYKYEQFLKNFEHLKTMMTKNNTNLKMKILIMMGNKCQENGYGNNLSVLICNIMYMTLIRNNSIDKYTLQDLQKNFDNFRKCISELNQGNNPILKLLSFAFLKHYLQLYLQIAKPQNQICIQIDNILCQKNQVATDLRFYCIRLLRRKLNPKQISQQYIKIVTFKWCELFKQQMKEQQSRSIQVPKIPQNMINQEMEQKIQAFKKFQGRDVALLDDIINLGSTSINGRYNVLNFFMKYIYSMAYNKIYQQNIIKYVKQKQLQYTQRMGKQQYKLLLKYSLSKFDDNYFVQKHETFTQMHFILMNNINWLLASKQSKSPVHSLFFNNGILNQSIQRQISLSFLPCGPENPYISVAKIVYGDTRNNNIGVYLCSNDCDYIYSHLNCGWPNQTRPCLMCGESIGSGGGHKIARADKGGKRVMSQKFLDNSSFYIGQFLKLQQFWDAQRCYIQAQINRMRVKSQVTLKPQINKVRSLEKQNLLGYNMTISNNRISTITSKIIMLCIQSSLYTFVSLDLIKPQECAKLFGSADKKISLQKLNTNIQNLVKDIKQVVNLNTKFYTWIFGIQAQIYKILINFQLQFNNYIAKLDKDSLDIGKKLKDKIPALNNTGHKQLYTELARVIENGIISKQFKQTLAQNLMNGRNQFTRQVFQQRIQQVISSNFFEGKLAFVEARFESQGKMQFPFQSMLTESKQDFKTYKYSRILKIPSQSLNFDQIANKYEIIIRDRYPVLDYLLKNSISFKLLNAFKEIVQACNLLGEKVDKKFTRFSCKNLKLSQFNKKYCNSLIDYSEFFPAWERVSKDLGPVQIGCKTYGKMNDQLNQLSAIYNFLLDDTLKFNASGKQIVGIFHNFALVHNEVLNILKSRKNLIPKYKKMNFFVQNYRKSPQLIATQDCIFIKQEQIMKKMLQASVPSIKYGQNLVYHNFDFCQAYFLKGLKGKCELQPQIQKYVSIQFVGEMFSKGSVNTNATAVGDVRDVSYEQLSQQSIKQTKQWFQGKKDSLQALQLFGQLQKLINKISLNAQSLLSKKQQFRSFIKSKCSDLNIKILTRQQPFSELCITQIIPLYELTQQILRLRLQKTIPEMYTKELSAQHIQKLKSLLQSLPKQQSDFSPTPQQLLIAIQNFLYRNLLSEFYPEDSKIFEFVLYKEDYWPLGYDIYTKNIGLFSAEVLKELEMKNCVQVMKLVEGFVKL